MRHCGVHVGSFFLAEKEAGREFTSADEEVLVIFASQAAAAIANARTYRDERRARADMEALVETSPVGVAVFDARTGALASLNREAKRIVEGLRMPGHSAEELLEVLTSRRADGREVALAEIPLAQQLSNAETVRAEEIVLSPAWRPTASTSTETALCRTRRRPAPLQSLARSTCPARASGAALHGEPGSQ